MTHADVLPKLDDVAKLDLSNAEQAQLLHAHLGRNMAAINFWLNFCVLRECC